VKRSDGGAVGCGLILRQGGYQAEGKECLTKRSGVVLLIEQSSVFDDSEVVEENKYIEN
jgi:hypothetical protein